MPQTLAQLIRAKHQGAYDDLSDEQLERSIKTKYPGVYDDLPTSSLPTRPVSVEDFLPAEPSAGEKAWRALKAGGRAAYSGLEALSDFQRGSIGGDPAAAMRTGERIRNAVESQVGEFGKSREDLAEGRVSEGLGHLAAGVVPLMGPAAAHVGELAETDPYAALGEGAVLLGGAVAPAVAPVAGRGVQAAGRATLRGAGAAGRAAADVAGKVGPVAVEVAKTGALEAAAHAMGLPPLVASGARVLLENSIRNAKAAKAAKVAAAEEAAAAASAPKPNAGGTLVRDAAKAPTLADMLSESLADIAKREPPARITTPPQPDLPPSYTPRTTVPKPAPPKPVRATRPVQTMRPSERPGPAHGPQGYFLRKPAASEPVEPTGRALTQADLPESWRGRTGQPLEKPSVTGKIDPAEVQTFLDESGLTAEQAIDAVTRDASLPANVRIKLREAINKTRFKRAQ